MNQGPGVEILRLIAQFNLLPSIELHPDHRGDYAPDTLWQALAAGRLGHRQLSARILEHEGLKGDWVAAFETRERRLALLGWRGLERLITLTGIALNAVWIATRIDRQEVANLKSSLGAYDYAFAMGRARFLGTSLTWPTPPAGQDVMAWIRRAGRTAIDSCTLQQPRSFRRRLELRLADSDQADGAGNDLPAMEPNRVSGLFRKLAPEVGPQCVSLLS